MTVIWSGITEGGAIVPVQVDETGKVIATAEVREEYWAQNGNQLIPVNASNDIATYGKIVLGRASSGTSTLQSPPDAAGEVFTFPKTGGTLAIVGDAPEPQPGLVPHAYGTILNGNILVNSFNIDSAYAASKSNYTLIYNVACSDDYPLVLLTFASEASGSSGSPFYLYSQTSDVNELAIRLLTVNVGTPSDYVDINFVVYDTGASQRTVPSIPFLSEEEYLNRSEEEKK